MKLTGPIFVMVNIIYVHYTVRVAGQVVYVHMYVFAVMISAHPPPDVCVEIYRRKFH